MSWKALTPSAKKKITSDWNEVFGSFGVYKPMHLLRRAGPLLTGILLEKGSSNDLYKPTFHVHNLARVFPVISLGLPCRVPNEYVHVEWHDSKFREMAQRIAQVAYLPLTGELTMEQVLDGFHCYLAKPSTPYEPDTFRDMALICGWCGNQAEVSRVLQEAEGVMSSWPVAILKQLGGLDSWLSAVRTSAENQDALIATTAAQIAAHGIEGIPAVELK